MNRLVIALLTALDSLTTAAVGLGVVLAPLALFWATTGGAGWDSLWPAAAHLWQLGNLVPLHIALPDEVVTATGIAPQAASFFVSLAPLAFTAFAAIRAARSGARANLSGGWFVGWASGTIVIAGIAWLVAATAETALVSVVGWHAVVLPTLVYSLPLLIGGLVSAWRHGDGELIDYLHDRVDEADVSWSELPSLAGRGLGMLAAFFLAFGALAVVVALVWGGDDMIALFQSNRVDLWGAVLLTLAHLAYLPTLIVWGASWVAGPGFSLGAGGTVGPVLSEPGILPSLPIFGLVPDEGSVWLLAVVILPLAASAFTGWTLRSRFAAVVGHEEPIAPRVTLTLVLAALAAGGAALIGFLASGGFGPGAMASMGPHPGWVALAVGVEVLIGLAVMLLPPKSERGRGGRSVDVAYDDDASERTASRA